MSPETVASLCSGYGGLEMALDLWRPGAYEVTWQAETDPHASEVLAKRFPGVPNLGDFTLPGFWENAPRAEVHIGGVPCQGFSAAGRRKGADDERYLWPYWLDGIRIQRPSLIVFENVDGLTRGKMLPIFNRIVADLVTLGYDAYWRLLGACAVGAAHHRHRVFLLACPASRTVADAYRIDARTCGQRIGVDRLPTPVARDADGRGEGGPEYWRKRAARRGGSEGVPLGAALNLLRTPSHRDGGARGQGSPEHMQRRISAGHAINLGDQLQLLPTPRGPGAVNGGPDQGTTSGDIALSSAVIGERFGQYAAAVERQIAVTGVLPPEPTEIGPRGGRRLAAPFSEWLMMLPTGHVTDILERRPALARCGNGVVPLQAATALGSLAEAMVAPTLFEILGA